MTFRAYWITQRWALFLLDVLLLSIAHSHVEFVIYSCACLMHHFVYFVLSFNICFVVSLTFQMRAHV